MANVLSVHERRAMGEIDKEANQEVKAHGLRGSVLTRSVNLREAGSEQIGFPSLPDAVNLQRWVSVWFMDETDRKDLLAQITKNMDKETDGLSKDEEATSREFLFTHNCDLLLFSGGPW